MNYSVVKNTFHFSIDCDLQLHTTEALLQELNSMVTSHNKQLKPYLGHINSLLTSAILKCKAAVQKDSAKPTSTPDTEVTGAQTGRQPTPTHSNTRHTR